MFINSCLGYIEVLDEDEIVTLYRFMSKEEYEELLAGKVLVNEEDHTKEYKTASVGFCFLDINDYSPRQAYEFLRGIVADYVAVMFEVDESYLTPSYGVYAYVDKITEYFTTTYSMESFRPVKVSFNFMDRQNAVWHDIAMSKR